jgi:hypothetical protein
MFTPLTRLDHSTPQAHFNTRYSRRLHSTTAVTRRPPSCCSLALYANYALLEFFPLCQSVLPETTGYLFLSLSRRRWHSGGLTSMASRVTAILGAIAFSYGMMYVVGMCLNRMSVYSWCHTAGVIQLVSYSWCHTAGAIQLVSYS